MVVKMLTKSITSSLDLISVAVVSSPHLLYSLPYILALADQTGGKIHHVSVQTGVVSLNDIFSACLTDFNFL